MRKVILITMVSCFLFSGMMGLSGAGMAQPLNDKEPNCTVKTHPRGKTKIKKLHKDFGEDVLAVFVLKNNGNIEVMEGHKDAKGNEIYFRKPQKAGGTSLDEQPPGHYLSTDIPIGLEDELKGGAYRRVDITTFVGESCVTVNGLTYCW